MPIAYNDDGDRLPSVRPFKHYIEVILINFAGRRGVGPEDELAAGLCPLEANRTEPDRTEPNRVFDICLFK